MIPRPGDAPSADARLGFDALQESLGPDARRLAVLAAIEPATEANLRSRLREEPTVLHFVGHGRIHRESNYAALTFTSADGRARSVNLRHAAGLLAAQPSLRLIVLQGCSGAAHVFADAAAMLVAAGVPAVIGLGPLSVREHAVCATTLYRALARGQSLRAASDQVRDRLALASASAAVVLAALDDSAAVCSDAPPAPVEVAAPRAVTEPRSPRDAIRDLLAAKRAAGLFDVFLCHNGRDKPAVKRIAAALQDRGILPWLDEWELPPGQPWQRALELQIAGIRSAAVFVGSAGLGPWQEREVDALLRTFVVRGAPVIPVLLDDAPAAPELPLFLGAMTWVDFRQVDPEPLERLAWGITGERPE